MKKETNKILESLDKGKISSKEAIDLILNIQPNERATKERSTKLKIRIIDKEEGTTIKIPGIPFWMITSLGNIGIKLSTYSMKHNNNLEENTKKHLDKLKDLDLREIFDVLKHQEACDIVEIEEGNGNEIKISIF